MLLIFLVIAVSVASTQACRGDSDPVTYDNGSLVYCNPNPGRFPWLDRDPYARYPVCGPDETCEYRWMGLYSCCRLPNFPRERRLFSPLVKKLGRKASFKKTASFQRHQLQQQQQITSIAELLSRLTGGNGLEPSGYINNNGGGSLPGPGISIPTFPGPITTPVGGNGPGVYGPGPAPVVGQGPVPTTFLPGPPAPRPNPQPLPNPLPPRPYPAPQPDRGEYVNLIIAQPTPAPFFPAQTPYRPTAPPFRPPVPTRPTPPQYRPPSTPQPTYAPRTLPTLVRNPRPTYGRGSVVPLSQAVPIPGPYRPQQQPLFDTVWNEAPVVPWMYEAQLPPGMEVINIKCIIQSDRVHSGFSAQSVSAAQAIQARPEVFHPPRSADESFFRNRLPLCPRGVTVLRRSGGSYRALSRRSSKR